ncbi:arginine N-succinyltransferase [Sandarakinorhabdus sp.]|uniref:arginine N-succinyltransferase n=1 Tax=Sandarakinorhabdus sp. TaxID=1916663 RepID=UPI00286E1606|nr:arginine N-succinyltransferase [Sandarakinorhabdus sp.]
MSWRIRPARGSDLDAVSALADMTGGGFTNLPQNREALAQRLARSDASFARADGLPPEDELYILLLEEVGSGRIGGCGMVFSRIGSEWPFFSYKLGTLSQTSKKLGRSFAIQFLSLTTDHDGASEVGGLFLHPDLRTGGLGRLLARARYLFIAQHRARFGDKLLAELRGVLDEAGDSPFWNALGRQFFGMGFPEADRFNACHGNQFIADLMPKHPIYTALLPEAARSVIGQPHPSGRAALAMLMTEGFSYDNYVDIFDGGPTVTARTDQVRSIRDSRLVAIERLEDAPASPQRALIASGALTDFQTFIGHVCDDGRVLARGEAEVMGLKPGDMIRHVAF